MRQSFPYRLQAKSWYLVLLCTWVLIVLPVVLMIALWGGGIWRGSLELLGSFPKGYLFFAVFWLPVLTAPFGLFERIYPE
jgi:uncharacterized membrane protein